MLTYQLQNRVCKVEKGKPLSFPNDVKIEIVLNPPEPFGAAAGLCRTAIKGHTVKISYNANVGRVLVEAQALPVPLQVVREYPNLRLEVNGNKLIVQAKCNTREDFENLVSDLHYVFPILLNLEFADAPMVKQTSGYVGAASFEWLFKEAQSSWDVTTTEHQEKRIVNAFERLACEEWQSNRRLLAALSYFHMACRLIVAGNSPWEFMAEAILNLSKALDILFVKSDKSMDDVRVGLEGLGYSKDEIESTFIPIMVLRNYFDVAHSGVSLFKSGELQVLYKYLSDIDIEFRDLLRRILDRVCAGTYTMLKDPDLIPDKDKGRKIGELVTKLKKKTGNESRSKLSRSK